MPQEFTIHSNIARSSDVRNDISRDDATSFASHDIRNFSHLPCRQKIEEVLNIAVNHKLNPYAIPIREYSRYQAGNLYLKSQRRPICAYYF